MCILNIYISFLLYISLAKMFVFNTYSSLLLPAVLQCTLFAVLTGRRYLNEGKQSDLFLAIILLFIGIKLSFWMLGFAGWYDSHDGYTTLMFYFPFSAYLLTGPIMYFYFKSLTNSCFKISQADWPHLILPALFLLMIVAKLALDFLIYYPFPHVPNYQFGTRGPLAEIDKSPVVSFIGFTAAFYYLVLILKSFPSYKKYVGQNFSNSQTLDFNWLRNMLFALFSGVLILFIFKVLELVNGGITYKTDWYSYVALAIISYYLCINGYYAHSRQFYQLAYQPIQAVPVTATSIPIVPTGDEKKWLQTIDKLMQTDKPYLQPELSLNDMAKILGINKSVLSRVINQYHDQNFNDFVNEYRVNQVISQIRNQKHLEFTLLSIAVDCGFNSKATFNRAFKKATGLSPQEYIRREGSTSE